MPKSLSDCHSCAQKFEAQYPYCPYCGQKAQTKLTLGVLFNNTINNYFSVDARFFKSFVPLILKPGYLAKKFVQGKRAYLHPAQFYLFISIVFFFLFSFISRKQSEVLNEASHRLFEDKEAVESLMDNSLQFRNGNDVGEKHRGNVGMTVSVDTINSSSGTNSFNNLLGIIGADGKIIDSLISADADKKTIYKNMGMKDNAGIAERAFYKQLLKYYKSKDLGNILKSFYDTIPIAMFFLLPIFALILKFLFFRKGRFAHHLVFTFYYFSFLFLVFSVLMVAHFLWKNFPGELTFLIMLSTFFYLVLAVRHFYNIGFLRSFFKSGIASFAFLMVALPSAAVLVAMAAFLFG